MQTKFIRGVKACRAAHDHFLLGFANYFCESEVGNAEKCSPTQNSKQIFNHK